MNPTSNLRLSDLINPQVIDLKMQATNRAEVLTELAAWVPGLAGQSEAQQALVRALTEREQLHSTGIGEGVALPHARAVLAGLTPKPIIVFGRHPNGVDYSAIDQQPVRLFFLLLATNMSEHLHILARISRLVRQASVRQQLLEADSAQKIIIAIREAEIRLGG